MSYWYNKVESNISSITDCIDHFEKELIDAKREVILSGRVEKNSYEASRNRRIQI